MSNENFLLITWLATAFLTFSLSGRRLALAHEILQQSQVADLLLMDSNQLQPLLKRPLHSQALQ
jgi:hypothetical protein